MWWVMMVAMMLPSAAPMLLLFARVNRKEKVRRTALRADGSFRGRLSGCLGWVQRRSPPVFSGNWSGSACFVHDGQHEQFGWAARS